MCRKLNYTNKISVDVKIEVSEKISVEVDLSGLKKTLKTFTSTERQMSSNIAYFNIIYSIKYPNSD